jgi:peptide/nickel transport system ATP-binding protein
MKTLLEIKNLKVIYEMGNKTVEAVSGANLNVRKGEVLGLVGESGSGKTTLGLSVIRLLPYNAKIISGEIVFEGEDLLKYDEKDMKKIRGRRIAMIFQDPFSSLNPVSRIKDHFIELFRSHYKNISYEEIIKRSRELLKLVEVPSDKLDSYPHQLSGGQRQRIAIALAIALEPDLIIADEPTSSLDVLVEAQVMELFRELKRSRDISMIFITHNMALVSEIADRIAVMYAGKIVEIADAEEIFINPMHPYTQALMASVPEVGVYKKLRAIPGEPPSLMNPPRGCRFHPRCPYVMDICRSIEPTLKKVGDHYVACHLYK